MDWKKVRLGDYISIKSGLAYKGSQIGKGESILLGMGCVSFKDKFVFSGARLYNDVCDDRFVVKPGDIVLATRQQSDNLPILAMPAVIPHEFAGKRVIFGTNLYKVDNKSELSNEFLFWLFKHQHYVNYIASVKSGTAVQMITKKNVEDYKFLCPPFETREKIASILSAYDSLIENNTKRIRLLEQMAENLYKEWFAYSKIKGHSKDIRLADILSYSRGLSYSSEDIDCECGNDLINLKNIQSYGGFRLDGTKKYNGKYKKEQIVKEGDLIMGVTDMTQDRRAVGSVALIPNICNVSVISADLIKLESDIDNVYLYAMFRWGNVSKYISQFANGANVLHLRPQILKNIKVLLPSKSVIFRYTSIVKPMFGIINRLNSENEYLAKQRDALLPRLMSGKLEVKA